jgi:hypothetical protein
MNKNFAEGIVPKDDAFHGSLRRIAAEWWYFDAILNNNMSVHVGFKTFTKKNKGFVSPIIDIYIDGKLKHTSTNRFLLRRAKISRDIPSILLLEKPVIMFDREIFESTGKWCYKVKLKIKDLSVNLDFIGLTEGWKIETPLESWIVALPKARVTGKICIKNKSILVEGIGYHDHNWNYSMLTLMNYGRGWYWGKISSETITITWANIIKSLKKSEILAVLNQDGKGFFNIKPEKIFFKSENFIKNHRKKIPSHFIFKINDEIDNKIVETVVKMEVEELHFDRILIAPYWRYHVKAQGKIVIADKVELVNDIQIMEYIKF